MKKQLRIGFAGLGRMGSNMARNLSERGYPVTRVYDANHPHAEDIAASLQSSAAKTLSAVTEGADIIITVVGNDSDMDQIFSETKNSLLSGATGKIFLNCATVLPKTHIEVERRCRKAGAKSLEVSMAGSIPQARNGSLFLIVGGEQEVFDQILPLLEDISSSIAYIGASGEAAKMKALVNMVMNINTAGLAEGLGLADALGLDLTLVRDVFSKTGAMSRVLETDGADMQNRDHEVYFSASHAAKDAHIATELAHEADLFLPLAEATAMQYDRMVQTGLGELDKSGISELTFRERAPDRPVPDPAHTQPKKGSPMAEKHSPETIVPIISSGTPGPLGILHLPRLWTKLTLGNAGLLPEGYHYCGQGYDQLTISNLGLDKDSLLAFVKEKKPTYVQFEEYVKKHGKTDAQTITIHNEAIRGYIHAPELAQKMREDLGVTDEKLSHAVALNMLDDLALLHRKVNQGQ